MVLGMGRAAVLGVCPVAHLSLHLGLSTLQSHLSHGGLWCSALPLRTGRGSACPLPFRILLPDYFLILVTGFGNRQLLQSTPLAPLGGSLGGS